MDEQIYTRIILRNDSTTAWLSNKDQILLKGEVGIEFQEGGKVKMKIGDGTTTWENLPYFGGEDAHVYEATVIKGGDHIAAITAVVDGAELTTHDVAIVKEGILAADKVSETTPQKYQHTAYRWNGTAWVAFDGNYSAENVLLGAPITLAGNFTTIGNYSKGKVLGAGTSLQTVLSGMLQTTLQPTVTNPTVVITASGSDYEKEVGTPYTKPTATLTVTTGSYTYGPTPTGVTFPAYAVSDNGYVGAKLTFGAEPDAEGAANKTNASALSNNGTITLAATDYASDAQTALYTDSQVSYTFSGKGCHTDGAVAKDNLGGESNPKKQITSTSIVATDKTVNFRGFRYMYAGGTTAATIDSAAIRALAAKRKNNDKPSTSSYFEFKGVKGDTKVIFSYPASITGTPKFEIFTMAWGATEGFEEETVSVADARENAGYTDYKTFVYTPATPLAADETKYRVYF